MYRRGELSGACYKALFGHLDGFTIVRTNIVVLWYSILERHVIKQGPMQLTKQANYALRTMIYCAANPARQSRVSDIANAYGISELSLFKFIKPLVDSNLLESVRGRNGGIKLGRPAADITMQEVIEVAEEKFLMAECFGEKASNCPLVDNCEISLALSEALSAFLTVLGKYTVADLARHESTLRRLLNIDDIKTA